ncbi:MAG: threonine dehydratase, partial [Bacteroidota bacterium]|nr:threonine dehydratase [Bacteroidota bacterium]
FEYTKKNNREKGPALVGIQLQKSEDYDTLIEKLNLTGFSYELLVIYHNNILNCY